MVVAIILILLILFWGPITRFFGRLFARWVQNRVMKAAGLDPKATRRRYEEAQRRQERQAEQERRREHDRNHVIPEEYAEDADYVEIHDRHERDVHVHSSGRDSYYHEEQVSDADWEEIK